LFDIKRDVEYIICGNKQTKKQPTAKEHVEMFLKFNLRLFLSLLLQVVVPVGATLSSSRFDLAMINIL
jgi:hypothetical protein